MFILEAQEIYGSEVNYLPFNYIYILIYIYYIHILNPPKF
jgi:hypothetical protein